MQSVTLGPGPLQADANYKSAWLNLPTGTVLLKAIVLGDPAVFEAATTQFSLGVYHSPGGVGDPKYVMGLTFEGGAGQVAPFLQTSLLDAITDNAGEPAEIVTRVRVAAANLGSAVTLGVQLEAYTVDTATLLQLRRDILTARGIPARVKSLLAAAS